MHFKFVKNGLLILFLFSSLSIIAQRRDIPTWSAQIGLGLNSPSKSGFVDSYPAQSLNFPTVNLGVQRMFSRTLGARLDYGFNRDQIFGFHGKHLAGYFKKKFIEKLKLEEIIK